MPASSRLRRHHQPMRSGFGGSASGVNSQWVTSPYFAAFSPTISTSELLSVTTRRLPVLVGSRRAARTPSWVETMIWRSTTTRASTNRLRS